MKTIGSDEFEIDVEINGLDLTLRLSSTGALFLIQDSDMIVLGHSVTEAIEALEQLTAKLEARK